MEAELIVPQTVETGDSVKMKQVMDDAVIKAVLEMGYDEDHTLNNAKLSVMALACVFAVTAQFWPQPFPESRPLLAVCCLSYFACSLGLHLIVTYWEKDMVLGTTRNKTGSLRKGMIVRTDFPRFEESYTVSVEERKPGAKPIEVLLLLLPLLPPLLLLLLLLLLLPLLLPLLLLLLLAVANSCTATVRISRLPARGVAFASRTASLVVTETWNVGGYFDLEGNFDEWGVGDAMKKLVSKLEKRARDRKKKEKKERASSEPKKTK